MKNKGFTLTELLAVIAIISIISLITVPIVLDTINTSKEKLSSQQIDSIESSARIWGTKNLYVKDGKAYYNKNEKKYVTLSELNEAGILEKTDLKNINLSESEYESAAVCISYEKNQFTYTYTNNLNTC